MREVSFLAMKTPKKISAPGWAYIAKLLKESVDQSGLSVEDVATRAGTSRQYVYKMMEGEGNPTIRQIENVFLATGTPLERILNDKSFYSKDKSFHDRVQRILEKKGAHAVALRVVVTGSADS